MDTSIQDNADSRQYVLNFSEIVLLPRYMKQPGMLHFITGLRFDINCDK